MRYEVQPMPAPLTDWWAVMEGETVVALCYDKAYADEIADALNDDH